MTRRLLVTLALGSIIGAGGIGADSITGAAVGTDIIGADDPQLLHPLSQPASQPLSQQLLWQPRLPKSFLSNPPHFFVPHPHPLSQPESQPRSHAPQAGASQPQAGSAHPQAGAASQQLSQPPQLFLQLNNLLSKPPHFLAPQPQAGVASHPPHAGASQPQAGSAHPPQAGASHPPQAGSAHPHPDLPHPPSLLSSPQPLASQPQVGSAHPQAGASQPLSQAGAPHPQAGASQPQAGSAQPHADLPHPPSLLSSPQPLDSHPQVGSQADAHPPSQAGAPQPQADSAPQVGSAHPESQHELCDPQPFMPSMRSKRSKPKLWLQIELPNTRVNVRIVFFIGATSPKRNLAVILFAMFRVFLARNRLLSAIVRWGRWTKSPTITPQHISRALSRSGAGHPARRLRSAHFHSDSVVGRLGHPLPFTIALRRKPSHRQDSDIQCPSLRVLVAYQESCWPRAARPRLARQGKYRHGLGSRSHLPPIFPRLLSFADQAVSPQFAVKSHRIDRSCSG